MAIQYNIFKWDDFQTWPCVVIDDHLFKNISIYVNLFCRRTMQKHIPYILSHKLITYTLRTPQLKQPSQNSFYYIYMRPMSLTLAVNDNDIIYYLIWRLRNA